MNYNPDHINKHRSYLVFRNNQVYCFNTGWNKDNNTMIYTSFKENSIPVDSTIFDYLNNRIPDSTLVTLNSIKWSSDRLYLDSIGYHLDIHANIESQYMQGISEARIKQN